MLTFDTFTSAVSVNLTLLDDQVAEDAESLLAELEVVEPRERRESIMFAHRSTTVTIQDDDSEEIMHTLYCTLRAITLTLVSAICIYIAS